LNSFKDLLTKNIFEKISALLLVILLAFVFKSMKNILLLTLVLSFFFYTLQNILFINLEKLIPIKRSIVTAFVYVLIITFIVFILIKYIPIIINEMSEIANQVSNFDINNYKGTIDDRIINFVQEINIRNYIDSASKAVLNTLTGIGKWSIEIFLAFILSFFFIIEKEEIAKFGTRFESSRLSGQYRSIKRFGKSFLNSFAKVMEAQLIIAFVNSVLSMICLALMGFPQVIGLGFMIFVLGLIPVAGVWISLVPLSIIAFKVGGATKVLYVWIMIAVIHSLEAYVLNPKIMSINTKLPVFITFLVLLGAEHIMGIWGLLFGIPLFMFILDIFDIKLKNQ